MEVNREKFFAAIVDEDSDTGLAMFRELARALGIYVHVGSLAIRVSPDKAANRAFLIDPRGEIVARYDKIHMFDVDLANGESYRESRNYRAGEIAVVTDLPWGRLGLTVCYDLRFPALYRALAEAGARSSPFRPPSPGRPARRTGTCSTAPARSRTAASCSPPRKAASTRTAARRSAIRWWSIPGAASSPRAAPSRAWCWRRSIRPRWRRRAPVPSLQHGRRFELIEPMAEPTHLRAVRGPA